MPERILEELSRIALSVQKEFKEERRLLSFREYLTLFATDAVRHSRDASRYWCATCSTTSGARP